MASEDRVRLEEKIRLFWDNIPLWYNMGLFNYFEKMGGVVVAETYSAAWSMRLDANNFSVAQFQTRADAFMEMLLEKKGASCPAVSDK